MQEKIIIRGAREHNLKNISTYSYFSLEDYTSHSQKLAFFKLEISLNFGGDKRD